MYIYNLQWTHLESKLLLKIFQPGNVVGGALIVTHDAFHERGIFGQSRQHVGGQVDAVKSRHGVLFQELQCSIKASHDKVTARKISAFLQILLALFGSFKHKHFQKTGLHRLQIFFTHAFLSRLIDLAGISARHTQASFRCWHNVFEETLIACVEHKHGRDGRRRRVNLDHGCFGSGQGLDPFHVDTDKSGDVDVVKHHLKEGLF